MKMIMKNTLLKNLLNSRGTDHSASSLWWIGISRNYWSRDRNQDGCSASSKGSSYLSYNFSFKEKMSK